MCERIFEQFDLKHILIQDLIWAFFNTWGFADHKELELCFQENIKWVMLTTVHKILVKTMPLQLCGLCDLSMSCELSLSPDFDMVFSCNTLTQFISGRGGERCSDINVPSTHFYLWSSAKKMSRQNKTHLLWQSGLCVLLLQSLQWKIPITSSTFHWEIQSYLHG